MIIDDINFVELEAERYWSFPKSYKGDRRADTKQIVLSEAYGLTEKKDGHYCRLIKDMEGNIRMQGRSKSVSGEYLDKHEWVAQLNEYYAALPNGTVLLGELYFPEQRGSRKVTTILGCLKDKAIERQNKGEKLHYYVFDMWAYEGKSMLKTTYEKRMEILSKIANKYTNDFVEYAQMYKGDDAWTKLGEILARGDEGMVATKLNSIPAPGKRPAKQTLKIKLEVEDTIDAFIDGAYKPSTVEYSGKQIDSWTYWTNLKTGEKFNKCLYDEYCAGAPLVPITKGCYYGWASAVSFSVMKDGKPVHIAWISGIPDSMKSDIVNNPEKLVGKVFSLSAMEVEHIDEEYSLRHGRIDSERPDKEAAQCEWSQIADK